MSLQCQNFNKFSTGKKLSAFRVFLIRIFPHLDRMRRNLSYLTVFSPNAGKYGPEKLWIRTFFTQCRRLHLFLSEPVKFRWGSILIFFEGFKPQNVLILWKVSVLVIFLVRIFLLSDWIRRDTEYSLSLRI